MVPVSLSAKVIVATTFPALSVKVYVPTSDTSLLKLPVSSVVTVSEVFCSSSIVFLTISSTAGIICSGTAGSSSSPVSGSITASFAGMISSSLTVTSSSTSLVIVQLLVRVKPSFALGTSTSTFSVVPDFCTGSVTLSFTHSLNSSPTLLIVNSPY